MLYGQACMPDCLHACTCLPSCRACSLAYNLGVESIHLITGEEFSLSTTFLVFINGLMLGVTRR